MYFKIGAIVLLAFIAISNAEPSDRDVIEMINQIDNEKSLNLFGGLSVVESENVGERSASWMSTENVVDRAVRYLNSHELKFAVPNESRDAEEARSSKLKKLVVPLLLALKLKVAIFLPIILTILKLMSLKGLVAGTLALMFSGFTLVKDLLAKKKDHITTAYISGAPAVNAEIGLSEQWNRNGVSAQDLAYNYHTMPQNYY